MKKIIFIAQKPRTIIMSEIKETQRNAGYAG